MAVKCECKGFPQLYNLFGSDHSFAGEDGKDKRNEAGEEEVFKSSSIAITLSIFILLSTVVLLVSNKRNVTF